MQTDREREPQGPGPHDKSVPFPIPDRIPIIPLPNTVFFPQTYLPLHIFEPRYRQMVNDAAMGSKCIGVTLLQEGWESDYYGNPPIFPMGCVGRIVSVQPLVDGRSNILLQGLERFEIQTEHFDRPYREANIKLTPRMSDARLDPLVRTKLVQTLEDFLKSRDDAPTWRALFRVDVSGMHAVGKAVSAGSRQPPATGSPPWRSAPVHEARPSWGEGLGLMDRAVVIEVSRLSKSYDGLKAVEDLSFQVYRGEIFGLLGPNGAGKSTTLRTLITLLHPTSGLARVLGHDTVKDADVVRQLIGYVPQERAIDRFLTGREHLELLAALYHLRKDEGTKRIGELLKLVELEAHADRPAKTYSGGMKRKLDIACGLLPNPQILFLDEPTLGLDVQSRLRIWDYVRMLKARGMTVVMSTNYLDEADQLCDRLAIIDAGKIKTLGSPTELKVGLGGDIVALTIHDANRLPSLAEAVKGLPAIRAVNITANGLDIRVESPEKVLPAILETASRLDCHVEFIEKHRPRLDDVFIAHTGRAITESVPEAETT